MRLLCLAVLFSALLATAVRADELLGTWVYSNPDAGETITVVFNADGTGRFDDEPIRYVRRESQLIVTLEGEQLIYTIQLQGDQMLASGGDLEGRLTFTRQGAAATNGRQGDLPAGDDAARNPPEPANGPDGAARNPIVGEWTDGNGRIVFNADGSCDYIGQKMKYTYDGATLVLSGAGGEVSIQVKVEGDTFVATAGNETQKLTRVKAGQGKAAGANGAAGAGGVFVCSETSIDPSNVMSITQYLTLYPDGTIGWFKTELGASRTQVTECLERFASLRTNPQAKGRTYGTWQADAQGNVLLQWDIWDNLRCEARFDAQTGRLTVEKMGILSEGATLTYELQQ